MGIRKITDKKAYLLALFFKGLGITGHHAFLTLIFLNKGMTFAQIAMIQSMYSLAMVIFEFPSGLLSDLVERKRVYLASNFLMVLVFFLIYFSNTFSMLSLTRFIYGLSSALETGTIDSEIIIRLKEAGDEKNLGDFLGKSNRVSSLASLAGSGLGFFLYKTLGMAVYFFMALMVVVSSLVVIFFYEGLGRYNDEENSSLSSLLKNLALDLKKSRTLKVLIITIGILQMYIQVHFQLRQSYFLNLGISNDYFYLLYLIFQALGYLAYRADVNKLGEKSLLGLMALDLGLALLMFFVENNRIKLLSYLALILILNLFSFKVEFEIQKEVNKERIPSTISLVSTILRLFGFISLQLAGLIIKYLSLDLLFLIFPLLSIVISTLLLESLEK